MTEVFYPRIILLQREGEVGGREEEAILYFYIDIKKLKWFHPS